MIHKTHKKLCSHNLKRAIISQLATSILQRTAFSHPARAIVKVMAMITGELDYDDLFHQQEGEDVIHSLDPLLGPDASSAE